MEKINKEALLNMKGRATSHAEFLRWEALLTELVFQRPWDQEIRIVYDKLDQGGFVWYIKAVDEATRLSSI